MLLSFHGALFSCRPLFNRRPSPMIIHSPLQVGARQHRAAVDGSLSNHAPVRFVCVAHRKEAEEERMDQVHDMRDTTSDG